MKRYPYLRLLLSYRWVQLAMTSVGSSGVIKNQLSDNDTLGIFCKIPPCGRLSMNFQGDAFCHHLFQYVTKKRPGLNSSRPRTGCADAKVSQAAKTTKKARPPISLSQNENRNLSHHSNRFTDLLLKSGKMTLKTLPLLTSLCTSMRPSRPWIRS